MFSKRPSRSLTLVCSVSLLCASSFAAFLVYSNLTFFESLLPLVWFLSVAVASGICSLVLGRRTVNRKSYEIQEASNWWCGAVGLPCLATQVLIQNDCSLLFALSHLTWACGMIGLKANERKIPPTTLDINKAGTVTASLSALSITASCYKSGNLFGILGSAGLISSHAVLTSQTRFEDFSSFDLFLVIMAASNYCLALSLV